MPLANGTGHSVLLTVVENTTTNTAGATTESAVVRSALQYSNGTGVGQADRQLSRTVVNQSGSTTYNLSAFTNGTSSNLSMAKVREFFIKNTGNVAITVGPDVTAGWTRLLPEERTLNPRGMIHASDPNGGWTVTNGTNERVRVNVPSGQGSYQLVIIGTST